MHEYIATAPFGLEGVVAQELRQLGFADVRAQEGGARFAADEEGAFYANLWLRCADRVLLEVGRGFPQHPLRNSLRACARCLGRPTCRRTRRSPYRAIARAPG